MSQMRLTAAAKADLRAIWSYIACDRESAADHFLERLNDRFLVLASQPHSGELRNDLPGKPRCVSVGNYVIFFRPLRNGVEIARVVHGARNIEDVM